MGNDAHAENLKWSGRMEAISPAGARRIDGRNSQSSAGDDDAVSTSMRFLPSFPVRRTRVPRSKPNWAIDGNDRRASSAVRARAGCWQANYSDDDLRRVLRSSSHVPRPAVDTESRHDYTSFALSTSDDSQLHLYSPARTTIDSVDVLALLVLTTFHAQSDVN